MLLSSRYSKAWTGEGVSNKDYITNNFPEDGGYCLHCKTYIPNKYASEYHIKKISPRESFDKHAISLKYWIQCFKNLTY